MPQEVLDVRERDRLLAAVGLAQLILKAPLAELHDDVLDQPLLLVDRVEEVYKLDHIWLASQQRHDFILARDHIPCLVCPLDSHFHVSHIVKGFEDKSCQSSYED